MLPFKRQQPLGESSAVCSPSELSCVPTVLGWGEVSDSPSSQQEVLNVTVNKSIFLGYLMPHVLYRRTLGFHLAPGSKEHIS